MENRTDNHVVVSAEGKWGRGNDYKEAAKNAKLGKKRRLKIEHVHYHFKDDSWDINTFGTVAYSEDALITKRILN